MKLLPRLAYLLLVFGAGWLTSCTTPEASPDLPAETSTGANTLGCRINGEVWTASRAYYMTRELPAVKVSVIDQRRGYWHLDARHWRKGEDSQYLDLDLVGIRGPGSYQLTGSEGGNRYGLAPQSGAVLIRQNASFVTDSLHTGTVVITRLDTVARVLAGTFSFTGTEPTKPDPKAVIVSDGRFDVKY